MEHFPLAPSMVSRVVGLLGYMPPEGWKALYKLTVCYALGRAAKEGIKAAPPKPSHKLTLPTQPGPETSGLQPPGANPVENR